MITGRNKRALEDHVDREPFPEQTLAAKGEHAKLAAVQTSSSLADLHYQSRPRQLTPRGPTGHGQLPCPMRNSSATKNARLTGCFCSDTSKLLSQIRGSLLGWLSVLELFRGMTIAS